jgi:hypothetical protein
MQQRRGGLCSGRLQLQDDHAVHPVGEGIEKAAGKLGPQYVNGAVLEGRRIARQAGAQHVRLLVAEYQLQPPTQQHFGRWRPQQRRDVGAGLEHLQVRLGQHQERPVRLDGARELHLLPVAIAQIHIRGRDDCCRSVQPRRIVHHGP